MMMAFVFAISATQKASAQSAVKMAVASADTLSNTDTTSKVLNVSGGFSKITFQVNVSRLSGTAAGSVVLYGSLDGVNYVSTGDTLTLTNQATNTAIWDKGVPAYTYYKVVAISSGTVSEVLNVWYLTRKYQTGLY